MGFKVTVWEFVDWINLIQAMISEALMNAEINLLVSYNTDNAATISLLRTSTDWGTGSRPIWV
jgi:hypothetical protein